MMYGRSVEVKIELGHKAILKEQATAEGYTHDWTVFVKGPEGCKIENFVEKVIFLLHESFPKSKRTIREPPFQVTESGYAGFNMPIWVYFKTKEEPKKIEFVYDLYLSLDGKPINNIRCEKLTFHNPPDDFCQKLLKGGGSIKQPAASPNKKPSGPQTPPEKRSPQQPQGQSGVSAAKPFTDLFGAPIVKEAKSAVAPLTQDVKKDKKKDKRNKEYKKDKKDKDGRSRDKDKETVVAREEKASSGKDSNRDKEKDGGKSDKERDKSDAKTDQERDKVKESSKEKDRTSAKDFKDKESTTKPKESGNSKKTTAASVRSSQSPPSTTEVKKEDVKSREDRKRPLDVSPSGGNSERDKEKTGSDEKDIKKKKKSSSHKDAPDVKKPRLVQDPSSGLSESLKAKRSKSRSKESLASSSPLVESNDDMDLSFTPSPSETKIALPPPSSERKKSAQKDKSASPAERKEVRAPPPSSSRSKKTASSSSSPSPMHPINSNSNSKKKSSGKQALQQQPIGALASMMMEMDAEIVSSPEPEERRRDKLSVLKVKILKLSDDKLQQVVDLIEETGKFELSNDSFDFNLGQIDTLTISRIQQLIS
ncbi:hypothetical protein BIW11_06565 [Tropilaelaps mercedesae]|uniref:YEATS domain-containing protein n=1 Tax=Tropilaelaps mercedesae TaxID=418985 RepID=A0A1V9XXK1_9ACAR|nr:hypothetical protein BIW11_06565 [Tropilaelaps mercedesae]